jgi:hypothetical protein
MEGKEGNSSADDNRIMNGSTTQSILTDSIDSLSSSRILRSSAKGSSSLISRTYKKASNLFLTRRLPECLQALEPIISTQHSGETEQEENTESALIATASKNARIKVWSLYITLLNAIIELGPEEGKAQFGSTQWRSLVAKVREGTVWEEVVREGYHGREGLVDADVVSNLCVLLLNRRQY